MLSLITARSYGQHNTVVYKPGDNDRGMPHRQTILVNPEDLAASGMETHQRVTVRRGAALMFYPEANALMRAVSDPDSGTPAFKRVPVLLRWADEPRMNGLERKRRPTLSSS